MTVEQSESIGKLSDALSQLQGKIRNPSKNAEGYAGRYSYATLDHVLDHIRPLLNEHALALIQAPGATEVTTTLAHESGEWIKFATPIETAPNPKVTAAQVYGSAVTYARRYALCGLFGIYPDEDDDGHSTGVVSQQETVTQQADAKRQAKGEPASHEFDEEVDHKYVAAMSMSINKAATNAELDEIAKMVKKDKSCNHATKQAIGRLGVAKRAVLDTSPSQSNGG